VRNRSAEALVVMVGLVPTIHVFATSWPGEDVDARHKAGHDGEMPAAARAVWQSNN
jgi:hypothetical protein